MVSHFHGSVHIKDGSHAPDKESKLASINVSRANCNTLSQLRTRIVAPILLAMWVREQQNLRSLDEKLSEFQRTSVTQAVWS